MGMGEKVRVRMAPSPTGHFHIGSARTALFNWLFARNQGGTFILRIEDTDSKRSTEESAKEIIEAFKWLGIDYDEGPEVGGDFGPYFQSQRLHLYHKYEQELIRRNRAYYCFCHLKDFIQDSESQKDCFCGNLSHQEVQKLINQGIHPAVRFRVPPQPPSFQDLLRGTLSFEGSEFKDFIIMKSEKKGDFRLPTYNFACVVDDYEMRITHVIRGDDHISNTPRQVAIYHALELPLPLFAHLPLILGEDGAKLSKRHGAVSLDQFAEEGYLPEAMMNFLALLGWHYDDSQELFSRQELISKFDLMRVSKNPAIFNFDKLLWMNNHYIKELPLEERTKRVIPFLVKSGLIDENFARNNFNYLQQATRAVGERLKKLSEISSHLRFLFVNLPDYSEESVKKFIQKPEIKLIFQKTIEKLQLESEPFSNQQIEAVLNQVAEELKYSRGKIFQPLRVALTGSEISFGIFDIISLLGKEKTLYRLKFVLDKFIPSKE